MFEQIIADNRAGGWRRLKRARQRAALHGRPGRAGRGLAAAA
jgi:hypothetical protein